jgi:hypothetical protein
MYQVNAIRGKNDYIYATSSLNFFETLYYSGNRNGVFFYSPSGSPFPWFVGEAIFDQSQMAFGLPKYPSRAIMVTPEGKISVVYEIQPNPALNSGAQTNKPQ